MKRKTIYAIAAKLVLFLLLTNAAFAQTQGKVVINEYLPRTSSSCGTTSEFVELMNFGPGPVNIGCYILTTGVYSITIPPNTILQPGEFYIIAGQNFIPGNCANVDSTATGVNAKLNWNNCNCTNKPIPTTGEGMMKDDGSTPLVLFDPSLNVIDAVVRSLPGEPSVPITSSSSSGRCTSTSFNLSTMNINYEQLGMAPGVQNSFARALDGDCNWLKQPNVSGNATNNRKGNTTDITYQFDGVNLTDCGEDQGTVSIFVKHSNYASIFPMTYTVALDQNGNGFDLNDNYRTDTVYDPPFIEIRDLPIGRYRVTVASVKGCYLQSFDFNIVTCEPGTLPVRLSHFKNTGTRSGQHHLEWLLQDVQNLQSIVVEKGSGNGRFITENIVTNESFRGDKLYTYAAAASPASPLYRLKITPKNGRPFYSPVINTASGTAPSPVRIGPNPARERLEIQLSSPVPQKVAYLIYNNNGIAVKGGNLPLAAGGNNLSISLYALVPGTYQLQINDVPGQEQPISFRFVKH